MGLALRGALHSKRHCVATRHRLVAKEALRKNTRMLGAPCNIQHSMNNDNIQIGLARNGNSSNEKNSRRSSSHHHHTNI